MTPRNMRQPTLRFFKGLTQERSNSSAPNVYLIELSRAKNGVFSLLIIKDKIEIQSMLFVGLKFSK